MSSASRALAVLLSSILAVNGTLFRLARAEDPPETCLLLKISSPGVSLAEARKTLEPLPDRIAERLRIRWVAPDPSRQDPGGAEDSYPEADAERLGEAARKIAEASRLMGVMETAEAARALSGAEALLRKLRFGEATRPYLAELFFREGILKVWEGNEEAAGERFARSLALRPGFSPEPALHSPAIREAWERAKERPVRPPELLVQSLPPGSVVLLDGRPAGTTPVRVSLPAGEVVRVRVESEGFRAQERTVQSLPGDSGMLEFTLGRDPSAELAEMLATAPEDRETGSALGRAAERAGAVRAAVLVVGVREGTGFLRVLAWSRGEPSVSVLGEAAWPEGEKGAGEVAERAANWLVSAGWPGKTADTRSGRPWYHNVWFWAALGAVALGIVAAGAGGGGGGSGSSGGTIGVNF